jgi:hypothetical protein
VEGFDLLVDLRDRFRTDPVGPFDERSRHLYEQLLAPLGLDGQVAEGGGPPAPASAPVITASFAAGDKNPGRGPGNASPAPARCGIFVPAFSRAARDPVPVLVTSHAAASGA